MNELEKKNTLEQTQKILELIQYRESTAFSDRLFELFEQLATLHRRENEVIEKIYDLIKDLDEQKYRNIETLSGLSTRTYNCLTKYTNIRTVADVLNFPKTKWNSVQGFGVTCAENLEKEINGIGYTDFRIILDHNRYK